jgi:hypothetical protein
MVIAVFFTGFLAALGVPGLYVGVTTAVLSQRPYPAIDLTFLVVRVAVLMAAFVVLILPSSRHAVGVGRRD